MKNIALLFVAVTFLLIAEGCRRSEKLDDNKPTIALVLKTLNNPYFIDMQNGAEAAAKRFNVNIIVQAADREVDVEKQMQIIENLIQMRVNVICVAPSGSQEIVPAILKANEADIPIIAIDTRVDKNVLLESGGEVLSFIGSDNKDGGKLAGQFIVNELGKSGNVAILEGIPGHETGDARLAGFYEVANKSENIKVVVSQTANWERDQGYNVMQNILQAHPEIEAVFACNDMMALGAVEAISAANRTGEIIVVGFDAISDCRAAIKAEEMHASIAQHPEAMGRLAVEYALKVINGESIPDEIPVGIELITKENL
ncbi:MAG: sugar ABC transporter substrate-binding protein [Bacteroidetes bacterium]|nr:sugar ABC transporter substrate-binding protein [Bacteroidota bacterium]